MTSPVSKYATKSPDFKLLIKQKIGNKKLEDKLDFIFISELTVSNFIEKVIIGMRQEYPNLYAEFYNYNKFIVEIPKVASIPLHEFAQDDEVNELLSDYYKTKADFPKIKVYDPPVVWLGARPGDIIKIHRISETAGKAPGYRLVIK